MEIKSKLNEMGLTPGNAIVIGSGILNALKLRESNDIDAVVTSEKYQSLALDSRFKKEIKRGREILANDLLEIMTSWTVLGKTWTFDNLLEHSIVIDGVRIQYRSIFIRRQTKLAGGQRCPPKRHRRCETNGRLS